MEKNIQRTTVRLSQSSMESVLLCSPFVTSSFISWLVYEVYTI